MKSIFFLSLKYLFSALQDCVAPLKRAAATAATEETASSLSDAFEADIRYSNVYNSVGRGRITNE